MVLMVVETQETSTESQQATPHTK